MREIRTTTLPETPEEGVVYLMEPTRRDDAFYWERVDRNIGWVTKEEQAFLRSCTVGIAGCGGMGGLVAQILLRAGVGRLKIADCEVFDISNLNRQVGAQVATIGRSKALATAELLWRTVDDTPIAVYPQGINEECVDHFLADCDLVLDEIEYWAVAGRILLHVKAREKNIHVINCNTVGFGTRLFLFTPDSATIEDCFGGLSYDAAKEFDAKHAAKTASMPERIRILVAVALGLIPEFPEYSPRSEPCGNLKAALMRLGKEGKAPIFGTNPPMASGFLADHAVLHLLRHSPVRRHTVKLPPTPGYLYFDAGKMKAYVRQPSRLRRWMHQCWVNQLTKMATRKLTQDA